MVRRMEKKSLKDGGGMKTKAKVDKKSNVGKLMSKYRDVDEVLWHYVSGGDMVYDDMDFTIEEFADITGAEVDELIKEISRVMK